MVSIQICIGSACHLKGSYLIVEALQKLIKQDHLESELEIKAAFCLGNCTHAVSVKVNDEETISVSPETVDTFYTENILKRLSL